MEVIIQPNAEVASEMAARLFSHTIRTKPNAVLSLATGGFPVPLYRQVIQQNLDWSHITSFNLDEYIGVGADHPHSYHAFMHENLFRHVNINPANIHIPDGMAADPENFCRSYEEKIRAAGGIDIQLLGIGTDGHIGFNEPTSSLASRTRIKTLTASALQLHSSAIFCLDEEAASELIRADYYRCVFDNKPAWQVI